jgi:integrase/recombinase XerD
MLTKTICIMEKETDFARHLTIFLSDYLMTERGVSHHTLRSYAYTFDLMLDYMLEVKKIPAERIELKHVIARQGS